MEFTPAGRRWSSPPLAWQIVGLLLGGLVVAQLVTLVLTLLLPPEPAKQYELDDIARALSRSDATGDGRANGLQRTLQTDAPQPIGPGWLTSEKSRHELATLLGRGDDGVQLWFFTPLPFAGTARGNVREAARDGGGHDGIVRVDYRIDDLVAQAGSPRPPPGGDGSRGGGPTPPDRTGAPPDGTAFPSAAGGTRWQLGVPPSAGAPPGLRPAEAGNDASGRQGSVGRAPSSPAPSSPAPSADVPDSIMVPNRMRDALGGTTRPPSAAAVPDGPGSTVPAAGPGSTPGAPPRPAAPSTTPVAREPRLSLPGNDNGGVVRVPDAVPAADLRLAPSSASSSSSRGTIASVPAGQAKDDARPRETVVTGLPVTTVPANVAPVVGSATPKATVRHAPDPAPRGLFGLAPAPFVEGDFIAAVSTGDGWIVVQPVPEPFPNSWQRRVLLWFAIAFALIAPLGWLFARRVVRPIAGFAVAAERLGRDPTAPVMALGGPAEVGRAAHAFNRMQSRLRSFVDDRTAMIGAISHDLRTPLTRLRFRIEEVDEKLRDDTLRDGMLQELDEMEQMITSVLAFIRDASEPGSREKLDLSTIVEDVVEDAVFVGNDVKLTLNERAPVEVDAIGMRRLLSNLVENAVKYGDHARVRLFTDRQDAVTEVSDDGPGLPDDELERVFEPFYRAQAARASDKKGSGLGLAVCRSIARAHGGDVALMRGERGLIAQVRLPLAYGAR